MCLRGTMLFRPARELILFLKTTGIARWSPLLPRPLLFAPLLNLRFCTLTHIRTY